MKDGCKIRDSDLSIPHRVGIKSNISASLSLHAESVHTSKQVQTTHSPHSHFHSHTMNIVDSVILLTLSSLIPVSSGSRGKSKAECEKKFAEVDEAVAKISIALAKQARSFHDVDDFTQNYCR